MIPPTYSKPGAKRPSYTAGEGISEMYRSLGGAGLTLLCAGHMHDAAWIAPAEGRPFPMAIGGGPYEKCGKHGVDIATVTHVRVTPGAVKVRQTDLNCRELLVTEV